jgi:hypothetical protein
MCDNFDWGCDNEDCEEAYQSFQIALAKQFNAKYGTDFNDLAAWKSLCEDLGIDPIPSEIKQCREVCF